MFLCPRMGRGTLPYGRGARFPPVPAALRPPTGPGSGPSPVRGLGRGTEPAFFASGMPEFQAFRADAALVARPAAWRRARAPSRPRKAMPETLSWMRAAPPARAKRTSVHARVDSQALSPASGWPRGFWRRGGWAGRARIVDMAGVGAPECLVDGVEPGAAGCSALSRGQHARDDIAQQPGRTRRLRPRPYPSSAHAQHARIAGYRSRCGQARFGLPVR